MMFCKKQQIITQILIFFDTVIIVSLLSLMCNADKRTSSQKVQSSYYAFRPSCHFYTHLRFYLQCAFGVVEANDRQCRPYPFDG